MRLGGAVYTVEFAYLLVSVRSVKCNVLVMFMFS